MDLNFKVFLSNRTEVLFEAFKKALYNSSSLFLRKIIVVQDVSMKHWLKKKIAEEFNIAMGLEFVCLSDALHTFLNILNPEQAYRDHFLELAFTIENQLKLPKTEQIWRTVFKYVSENSTKKNKRRTVELSGAAAKLFIEYGKFGKDFIHFLEKESSEHWQQELWKTLFCSEKSFDYLYRRVREFRFESPPPQLEVFLFSINYLSELECMFFNSLGKLIPINLYSLSPCAMFWNDILSDYESITLQNYWQVKGASQLQQQALEEFLKDRNPLLANFGQLGRRMANQIENFPIEAKYQIPLKGKEEYGSLCHSEITASEGEFKLLHRVQSDLLLMRNPDENLPIQDRSIQIHIAATKFREIEILYQNLLQLMHQDTIPPSEIIVLAPDIEKYRPAILAIFGHPESQLPYEFVSSSLIQHNVLAQALLKMLHFAGSRWDACSFLELIEQEPFRKKFSLTLEEISQIRRWIQEAGIYWGIDLEHRKKKISETHCTQELSEDTEAGTWTYGFRRLILSQAMEEEDLIPIDLSSQELLNRWLEIFQTLQHALAPICEDQEQVLSEWLSYIENLIETFFYKETDFWNEIKKELNKFKNPSQLLTDSPFPFSSFQYYFEKSLKFSKKNTNRNDFEMVRFGSLGEMRSIPAKVVALLGLQEQEFPQNSEHSSLNLMQQSGISDFIPSKIDLGRYWFLEALLSARNYLMISCISSQGKENAPSIVVIELINYLTKYYSCSITQHPFYPFDKSYFENPDYPLPYFKSAAAFYRTEKLPEHKFIPTFDFHVKSTVKSLVTCDIKKLSDLAKNPLKFYFNASLKMFLNSRDKKIVKKEEDFSLTHLEFYLLKKEAFRQPLSRILSWNEKKGKFPFGLFGEAAKKHLTREVEEILAGFDRLLPDQKDIWHIEFQEGCEKPVHLSSNVWVYPPLQIKVGETDFRITGVLPNVSRYGLISMQRKCDPANVIKEWPIFLVFQKSQELFPICESTDLLFLSCHEKKSFSDFKKSNLENFLKYSILAEQIPSPLLPEWASDFYKEEQAEKWVEKVSSQYRQFYNEYFLWAYKDFSHPLEFYEEWRVQLKELYTPIFEEFY